MAQVSSYDKTQWEMRDRTDSHVVGYFFLSSFRVLPTSHHPKIYKNSWPKIPHCPPKSAIHVVSTFLKKRIFSTAGAKREVLYVSTKELNTLQVTLIEMVHL